MRPLDTDAPTENADPGIEKHGERSPRVSDEVLYNSTVLLHPPKSTWKPNLRALLWLQHQKFKRNSPRYILRYVLGSGVKISEHLTDATLWTILAEILVNPKTTRPKLSHISTIEDVVGLLRNCKKIIVLTGAGISVSSGIPDFRSEGGWNNVIMRENPDLPNPRAVLDFENYKRHPFPFIRFANKFFENNYKPSLTHHFIKMLEDKKQLLRNYTQNIDHLERKAGITKLVKCHGGFEIFSCTACRVRAWKRYTGEAFRSNCTPMCGVCEFGRNFIKEGSYKNVPREVLFEYGMMKPDVVLFGEKVRPYFLPIFDYDRKNCDLLLVIGTSLQVNPVALVPSWIPRNIPQILINREPINHVDFDVQLLGDADTIVTQLCNLLGGDFQKLATSPILKEQTEPEPLSEDTNVQIEVNSMEHDSHSDETNTEILPKKARIQPTKSNDSIVVECHESSTLDQTEQSDHGKRYEQQPTQQEPLVFTLNDSNDMSPYPMWHLQQIMQQKPLIFNSNNSTGLPSYTMRLFPAVEDSRNQPSTSSDNAINDPWYDPEDLQETEQTESSFNSSDDSSDDSLFGFCIQENNHTHGVTTDRDQPSTSKQGNFIDGSILELANQLKILDEKLAASIAKKSTEKSTQTTDLKGYETSIVLSPTPSPDISDNRLSDLEYDYENPELTDEEPEIVVLDDSSDDSSVIFCTAETYRTQSMTNFRDQPSTSKQGYFEDDSRFCELNDSQSDMANKLTPTEELASTSAQTTMETIDSNRNSSEPKNTDALDPTAIPDTKEHIIHVDKYLDPGTFYHHQNGIYIFPGAQITLESLEKINPDENEKILDTDAHHIPPDGFIFRDRHFKPPFTFRILPKRRPGQTYDAYEDSELVGHPISDFRIERENITTPCPDPRVKLYLDGV